MLIRSICVLKKGKQVIVVIMKVLKNYVVCDVTDCIIGINITNFLRICFYFCN